MGNIRKILFCALAAALCASAASASQCQLKMVGTMDIVTGSDGRLLVPVTVNGLKGYFRFDIGTPVSAIVASTSNNADLKRSTIRTGTIVHTDGQLMTEQVTPDLGLGGVTSTATLGVAPSLDKPDPREIGVLGFDVLRSYDVEFDPAHNKLNLFSTDHCPNQVIYWTRSAPVAALPIKTPGLADFSVVMQLDGKDMQTKISTDAGHAELSTRVAQEQFGLPVPADAQSDDRKPYSPGFKALTVDGLTIVNPAIYPYYDPRVGGCNGQAFEQGPGLHDESHRMLMRCYGLPDLYVGLKELSKLRVFFDFSEKMLYATAADAN
ncbi:MAG TPA: hypothetical protein VIJ62_03865 [Rhizomicrobium sp.]